MTSLYQSQHDINDIPKSWDDTIFTGFTVISSYHRETTECHSNISINCVIVQFEDVKVYYSGIGDIMVIMVKLVEILSGIYPPPVLNCQGLYC